MPPTIDVFFTKRPVNLKRTPYESDAGIYTRQTRAYSCTEQKRTKPTVHSDLLPQHSASEQLCRTSPHERPGEAEQGRVTNPIIPANASKHEHRLRAPSEAERARTAISSASSEAERARAANLSAPT